MILKQFVFLQNDFIFTQNNKISVFLSRKKNLITISSRNFVLQIFTTF